MTEGRAVMNAVMARPRGEARQVIREMAERNIGPAPANTSRAAAADYARRLEAEERRLLQAWNTEMDQQDRLTRQHDYCGDYAHRVWLRVMGMPGAFRSVEREAYDDCMAAFARVDRFSAPRTR